MPVTKQLLPFTFAQGIDTKTEAQLVQPGALLALENAVFTRTGAITKRFGYRALSRAIDGGGALTAAAAINAYDDELLLFSGQRVYSYLQATDTWADRGQAVSIEVSDKMILRQNDTQQLNPDVAYLGGFEVYAWENDIGDIRYSVMDTATGALAVSNGLIAAVGSKPRVVAFAGVVVIAYRDSAANILYRTVNPANPTLLGALGMFAADCAAWTGYDVCPSSDRIYISYLNTVGNLIISSYNTAFGGYTSTILATGGTASDGVHSVVDVCLTGDGHVYTSWASGTDVWTEKASHDLAFTFSPIHLSSSLSDCVTACAGVGPEGIVVAVEVHSSDPTNHFIGALSVVLGAVTLIGTLRSVGLASKGFVANGRNYVTVAFGSQLQPTYFVVDITPGGAVDQIFNVMAKIQPSTGGGLRTNGTASNVVLVSGATYLMANGTRGKQISESNVDFSLIGVNSTRLDFTSINRFLSVVQSNNLHVVGGFVSMYDGVGMVEHGFHVYPEGVTAVPAGSDGHLGTGSYEYAVTYEWTDNEGQIHRSAGSVPVQVSVTANNHVTLTIPTLRLTAKRGMRAPPSIVIYRTTANGVIFFRVTDTLAPLLNDPTVDTVQFVDILADADILSTELLYTTGGVLNNIAAPACKFATLFQGRVVVGGLEDADLLWFSKNKFDNSNENTIPVEFAAELTLGVDARGGPITGLGLLDDKLIIFKESSIFATSGDGPNDTGGGNPFPDAQMITSDVGCANPNSIVIMPEGLMFQSAKGIYLLDRSAAAEYIGAPVEAFNSEVITSSTLLKDTNQVVFTCLSGTAIVYDYYYKQWSTWTNHGAADSDTFGSTFCYVNQNGSVSLQDRTLFTDAGQPVSMSFTTPNYALAGLNGFQRVFKVYLLGNYRSPHTLNVSVAYDYSPVYTQTAQIDATTGASVWGGDPTWGAVGTVWGGNYQIYEYRLDLARQRCTAVRLQIKDTQTGVLGEGYSLSAMTFEVGAMPGGNRLPAAQIVGTS